MPVRGMFRSRVQDVDVSIVVEQRTDAAGSEKKN